MVLRVLGSVLRAQVEFLQELVYGGYVFGIEFFNRAWVNWDADSSCFGMYAERSFEQVVSVFRNFCIQTRIGVLENNVFHRGKYQTLCKGH